MRPRSSITPVLVAGLAGLAGLAALLGGLAWMVLAPGEGRLQGPIAANPHASQARAQAEAGAQPAIEASAPGTRTEESDSTATAVPPALANRPAPPYDPDRLPQPFQGVVRRAGRPLADVVVRYHGQLSRTGRDGRFHFPGFGLYHSVRLEPPTGPDVITSSSRSEQVIELPAEASAELEVKGVTGGAQRTAVRFHLVHGPASVASFLSDTEVVGQAEVDADGWARCASLSAIPENHDAGMLFAVAELPNGMRGRAFLGRPRSSPAGAVVYRGHLRVSSELPTCLRVQRQTENGREAIPGLPILYRTDLWSRTPWQRAATDDYGEVEIPWLDMTRLQVVIPLESGAVWNSEAHPLINMGDYQLALLDADRTRRITLHAPEAPEDVRFEVMRAARDQDGRLVSLLSPVNGRLEEGKWTACPVGEAVVVDGGMSGRDEALLIRAHPGGRTIHVAPLPNADTATVTLPPLCRLTVRAGEGALLPRGSTLWMMPNESRPSGLDALHFGRSTLGAYEAVVPQGAYRLQVYRSGLRYMTGREVVLDRARVEIDLDLEPREQTLRLSFDGQPLAQRPVTVESGEVQELRTAADGRLRFVNLTPGSCRLRVPPDATLPPIQVPAEGAELVRFLGWDAEVSLPSAELGVTIPVASLNSRPGNGAGTDFRLARLEEDGSAGAGVAIHFASRDAALTLRLPAGRYRLQAEGSPEAEELDLGANTRTEFTWNDD